MDDLGDILKVEINSSAKYTINDIFYQLAEEPQIQIFPLIASHYFLRFSSPVFSEYALNHRRSLNDVSVFSVKENLSLVEQYRQARSNFTPNPTSLPLQGATAESSLLPGSSDVTVSVNTARNEPSIAYGHSDLLKSIVEGKVEGHQDSDSSRRGFQFKIEEITSQTPETLSNELKLKGDKAVSLEPRSTPSDILGITCETQVNLNICGEMIRLDLENACSDVQVIIELFKMTKSERGNYLTAAAFYRRKKEPGNARQVLLSLIEDFTRRGISSEELRPAYLLLSGCEHDLARQAKNDKKEASVISSHDAAAKKWLQVVFGKEGSGLSEKQNCSSALRITKEKEKMREEIATLRNRIGQQEFQISELNSSKRKLQDELWYERDTRRRLEHLEKKAIR